MEIVGLLLAVLIGISLGLLGGGGSILAVPILVYVVGMAPKPAIAASLLVVGATSLFGALRHWRNSNIEVRTALIFGVVSMAGSYAGGKVAVHVSDTFQLMLFAVVMLGASLSMLRSRSGAATGTGLVRVELVIAAAAVVGLLTGLVGVGGGFLIVPALVLFAGLPMKRAVGTSLLVIAMNSMSGFLAYAGTVPIDWRYTALFTALAIAGVFAGSSMVKYLSQSGLKRAFAIFLIGVAAFILLQSALARRDSRAAIQESNTMATGIAQ